MMPFRLTMAQSIVLASLLPQLSQYFYNQLEYSDSIVRCHKAIGSSDYG
jgi:hypothetical protein